MKAALNKSELVSSSFATPTFSETPALAESVGLGSGGMDSPQPPFRHLPDNPIQGVIANPPEFLVTANSLQSFDLLLSLDTEYVTDRTVVGKDGRTLRANTILSYQFSAVYRDKKGDVFYAEEVIYPPKSERLSYPALLRRVFSRFGIGYRRAGKLRILSLAHHGAAEWAAYDDRADYLDRITVVRRVPITLKDMRVTIPFGSNHSAKPKVAWRDTKLFTPGGGGLDKASQVTTYKKIKLQDGWIKKMSWVLENHRNIFESYAINDTRVTLEYYLKTIATFERVIGLETLPITIGDASVKAFLDRLNKAGELGYDQVFGYHQVAVVDKYGKPRNISTKCPSRALTEVLASQAFLGGLNQAFHVGRSCENGYAFLDIDFSGAYPAALAVLPVINWDAHAHPVTILDVLNSYEQIEESGASVPIAFLHVQFEFPQDARHACLPVPSPYGLLYPRKGSTTCTGPEVALALQLGATIKILTSAMFSSRWKMDMSGIQLAFAGYLSALAQEREKHPKGSLENLLLKETGNSTYGKLAQGIEHRTILDQRGVREVLGPSRITCPHYAALCTGLVRTALAAVIATSEKYPGVSVLSATTDGCVLRIPFDGAVKTDANGDPIPPHLKEVLPGLYDELQKLYSIRALMLGRKNMGLSPEGFLESKHWGDECLTLKTRGYVLRWQGKPTFLAKCGHQLNGADALEDIHFDESPRTLTVTSLASLQDIASGKQVDLVTVETSRKTNTDYDYKRELFADGTTHLAETVADIIETRVAADTVRRSGKRATPEAVALCKAGVRLHGGTEAAIRRQIYRAVAHNIGGWRPRKKKDVEIAEALGISADTFKNAKRRKFLAKSLPPGPLLERVMMEIARKLGIKLIAQMRSTLTAR